MSKELIEKLRLMAFESLDNDEATMLHEAADALYAKAAPVGEREDERAAIHQPALEFRRTGTGEYLLDLDDLNAVIDAAYQRTQQPQSAVAVAFQKPSVLKDCNVWYSISTTPQPSASVVMPERKIKPYGKLYMPDKYEGWNACLDEFARLNGKEMGRG